MKLKFWINGRTTVAQDSVKSISFHTSWWSHCSDYIVALPLRNLTQYYDVQSSEFKDQGYIELQMKIASEKLDEIAKDENVESGVEDSGSEEK